MCRRALVGKEKALGVDHTSTLDTVNNLGNLYRDQDKLDVAEQMYRRALAGYEKALGMDHTSTLNTVCHEHTSDRQLRALPPEYACREAHGQIRLQWSAVEAGRSRNSAAEDTAAKRG